MITKFKLFEDIENEMKIGDFVLININTSYNREYREFINNNLGKVVQIDPVEDVFGKVYDYEVVVKYNKIPFELKKSFNSYNNKKRFLISKVVSFGKTPKDVEIRLNSNKYNL
jgi:hypothetical protein